MSLQDRLAESLEKVAYHGHYFSCLCVFHDNTNTPAMMVYPDKYYCKSCGAYGDLSRLDKKLHGVNSSNGRIHADAPRILPRWGAWRSKYSNVADMAMDAHDNLRKFRNDQYFFKQRKIIEFMEVGMFGSLDGWLTFPVFDKEHNIVDIVLRAGPSKASTIKYVIQPIADIQVQPLYVPDWDLVLKSSEMYVVYGIIDAWALYSLGLPVVTGITGKSLSADKIKYINKRIKIIPDMYEERDAHRLAADIGWKAKVVMIDWPTGTKDSDDCRRLFGDNKLRKLIQERN